MYPYKVELILNEKSLKSKEHLYDINLYDQNGKLIQYVMSQPIETALKGIKGWFVTSGLLPVDSKI